MKINLQVCIDSFEIKPCCPNSKKLFQYYVKFPQRSNAARVRNMSRFNGGKFPGNSKHFFKRSKDKVVAGKRSFKR